MKPLHWIKALFGIAALYDAVLGIAFLLFPGWVFATFQVTEPNHWGYVQFPAAILLIFAAMFTAIALNPPTNRNLIPYGVALKLAYGLIVIGYWATTDIPHMWKPFAVIDLLMAMGFIWSYTALSAAQRPTAAA